MGDLAGKKGIDQPIGAKTCAPSPRLFRHRIESAEIRNRLTDACKSDEHTVMLSRCD
jgi:hypothetical protein